MKLVEYFVIMEEIDKTEGRRGLKDTSIAFRTEEAAIRFASSYHFKQFAIMGYVNASAAPTYVARRTLAILDDVDDYKAYAEKRRVAQIRDKALAKLTKKEREVLGLD